MKAKYLRCYGQLRKGKSGKGKVWDAARESLTHRGMSDRYALPFWKRNLKAHFIMQLYFIGKSARKLGLSMDQVTESLLAFQRATLYQLTVQNDSVEMSFNPKEPYRLEDYFYGSCDKCGSGLENWGAVAEENCTYDELGCPFCQEQKGLINQECEDDDVSYSN